MHSLAVTRAKRLRCASVVHGVVKSDTQQHRGKQQRSDQRQSSLSKEPYIHYSLNGLNIYTSSSSTASSAAPLLVGFSSGFDFLRMTGSRSGLCRVSPNTYLACLFKTNVDNSRVSVCSSNSVRTDDMDLNPIRIRHEVSEAKIFSETNDCSGNALTDPDFPLIYEERNLIALNVSLTDWRTLREFLDSTTKLPGTRLTQHDLDQLAALSIQCDWALQASTWFAKHWARPYSWCALKKIAFHIAVHRFPVYAVKRLFQC